MERTKSSRAMSESEDIFDILKSEHRQVEKNFKKIINDHDTAVYSQTLNALMVHMNGEEKLLYPKLEANSNTRLWALKAYEEHNAGKAFAGNINSSNVDDKWIAQVEVLCEMISNHIDFEENKMFPAASKNVISKENAMEIGRAYRNMSQKEMPMTATM